MKIAIRQQLRVTLEPGTPRAIEHVLLWALTGPTQTVLDWAVDMPGIAGATAMTDAFGNRALMVTQTKPEEQIDITVSGLVDTIDRNGVVGRPMGDLPPALFRRPTAATKPVGAITSKFRSAARSGPDRIPLLHALMARVGEVLGESEETQEQHQDGQSQSQSQSSASRADATAHAHAFIGAARALEIPARFVTGYLFDPDGEHSGAHAWAEAWDDGLGWIGFDTMLQYCPTNRHVRVAVGLDGPSTVPVRVVPSAAPIEVTGIEVAEA